MENVVRAVRALDTCAIKVSEGVESMSMKADVPLKQWCDDSLAWGVGRCRLDVPIEIFISCGASGKSLKWVLQGILTSRANCEARLWACSRPRIAAACQAPSLFQPKDFAISELQGSLQNGWFATMLNQQLAGCMQALKPSALLLHQRDCVKNLT